MGGVSSTKSKDAIRFDSYLRALKSDRRKYLTTIAARGQSRENEHICPRITKKVATFFSGENKRVIYNTVWKTNMIEQLKNVGNEEWPTLLIAFLKSWDHDSTDLIYQSQISWMDFNNNRSAKLIGASMRSNITSSKDGDSAYLVQGKDEEKKKDQIAEEEEEENKLNEMLDRTDLFEENFYAAHGRTSAKSSMNIIPTHNDKYDEEKKSFSVSRSFTPQVQYKNNTFIHSGVPTRSMTSQYSDQKSHIEHLYASINCYKLVTGLIERHLQSSTHVFNQIISKFTDFYVNKYGNVLKGYSQSQEDSQGEIYLKITSAVSDLQQFIRILYEGMNLFYNLEKLKMGDIAAKENLFCRDNILNFITSIVLSVPLYEQVFGLLRINDLNTEEAFQKNLKASSKMTPEDMGVPPEYCLNERTLEFYYGSLSAGLQNYKNPKSKQRSKSPTEKASYSETERFVENVMSVNRPNTAEIEAKKLIAEPFQKCIDTLKRIEENRSPIHKMKTIVKTAELIHNSIYSFYKAFNIDNNFKLDSDQMLSIFIYIVARAGVKSLATQIKMIEKFATNNVLNSISGYYATTLEACINCIINLEVDEETASREEFYDNVKTFLKKSGNY